MEKALIVFTKNPVKGKVKTRLAATIGDDHALEVYQFLIRHTVKIIEPLIDQGVQLFVFYSEELVEQDEYTSLSPNRQLQEGEDLGIRMNNAFNHVLQAGFEKVIIAGTDIYEQTTQRILEAFEQLETFDLVVNPVKDGGYCLLGMKKPFSAAFLDKTWSHANVMSDLQSEAFKEGRSMFCLDLINDIDTAQDMNDSGLKLEMVLNALTR